MKEFFIILSAVGVLRKSVNGKKLDSSGISKYKERKWMQNLALIFLSKEACSNHKFKQKFTRPVELETNCIIIEVIGILNYTSEPEKYARCRNIK